MWLSYRCFKAAVEEQIPIFGGYGLVNQLGSVAYSRTWRFRAMSEQWLGLIKAVWPECPARINPEGTHLGIAPAQAVRADRWDLQLARAANI